MFTESRVVLQERLTAVEAHMPPDGETLQGTVAADVLAPLDVRQLKELAIFGVASLLRNMRPQMPFINNPDSDECREALAGVYLENDKFKRSPLAKGVFNLAHETLATFVAPTVKSHLAEEPISLLRAVKAAQYETVARIYLKQDGVRHDAMFIDSKRSLDALTNQITNDMWGASRQTVKELFADAGGVIEPNAGVDPKQFLRLAPQLRQQLSSTALKAYASTVAGISINHVLVLMSQGRIAEGFLDGTNNVPEIADEHASRSMNYDRDTAAVGCPARIVRGLVSWAPHMVLSACEAIATHPPIPTTY